MVRAILLILAAAAWLAAQPVEFWHLTDTHVVAAGTPGAKDQHRGAAEHLRRFLAAPRNAAFYLITGDLVDAYQYRLPDGQVVRGQAEAVQMAVQASPVPVYLCVGNHDIQEFAVRDGKLVKDESVSGAARAGWIRAVPSFAEGTWYRVERGNGDTRFALYVLDNAYAAAVAPEQLLWLKARLAAETLPVIAALHIPLFAEDKHAELRRILGSSPHLRLILAGHKHNDAIEELDLGDRKVTQVRTAIFAAGAARRIVVSENEIELYATTEPTRRVHSIALKAAQK
jgi:predicted MPP superfamily phosphohydrolase